LSKEEKIAAFDPNGLADSESLFGLPFSYAESETIVIPIPWEATVSYGSGTAKAPEAIRMASAQVDLYDPFLRDAWQHGIYMTETDPDLESQGLKTRQLAELHIENLNSGKVDQPLLDAVNRSCADMVEWVRMQSTALLEDGKYVALLGGDHSTPLGFIMALSQKYEDFGILQIDAHADLREAYEGFTYSHASIMTNALKLKQVGRLVQVGIRDYCEEEFQRLDTDPRISTFFDEQLKFDRFEGASWASQSKRIIEQLPEKVYVSFDIDGLKPYLCPGTGTPVAGGFEVEEVLYLIKGLVDSGREIIGLDLNEVAPRKGDDWDANVGARLLYRMCNLMTLSKVKK
jgi:agmatinase